MGPGALLVVICCLTAAALVAQRLAERRRRRMLRRLASEWDMNFNAGDQLRLAARVAHYFPVPGAASVAVSDVIYGIDGDFYRYIFTTGYSVGVLGTKRRLLRVAMFAEPRDRQHAPPPALVVLAPPELPLMEQYRKIWKGSGERRPSA